MTTDVWTAIELAEKRGGVRALRKAAANLHDIEAALDAVEELIIDAEDKPFRFTPTERRRMAIEDLLNSIADDLERKPAAMTLNPLKPKQIRSEYDNICQQFLINLLATGYRITNPEGIDITADITAALVRRVSASEET